MAIALLWLGLGFSALAAEAELPLPFITPTGGDYPLNSTIRVCIRSAPGTVVVYTLDGGSPAWNRGTMTDSNLVFFDLPPGDVVVKAAAYKPGKERGPVARARFTRSGGGR